jgi:Fur family ferric uptake transcriptional regulator
MQRKTQQRAAIRQAFTDTGRPLSPQEVLDSAQGTLPGLGIATVYRNIRALVEGGWLHSVGLPGVPDRYEIAGKHHHHHFHCRECDAVFEVEACPEDVEELAPTGFQVESHEITFYGLCNGCITRGR